MKVKEIRRAYITFTKEEEEILNRAAALIASIHANMEDVDELALIDADVIMDLFDREGLENISDLLFNMTECSLEIM